LLTKIEARNAAGNVLILPFGEPVNGVFIKDIEGLDPVKASIVTSSFATQDGEQYQAARRPARNIVMKLGFAPDWALTTPKSIRDNLYKWFMTKQQDELRFYEDSGLVVSITGRCESNDSPRLTSDPDATISMYCFLPDFIGMTNNTIAGGSVSDSTESTANYIGTTDTGFLFTLNVNRTITGFSLYMRGVDGIQYQMDFVLPSGSMVAGDVLKISTVSGNKYATLTHDGVDINVLYAISPSSPWLNLQPGANKIRLQISGSGSIPYTIQYTDKYGGL
jgi:hypothetical protein